MGEVVVGASGWDYRVPFAGTVEASLTAIQEQVLASGDFMWPFGNDDPFYADDDDDGDLGGDVLSKPVSVAALARAKENEEFWDEGTHTVLDVERVWKPGDEGDFAAIRPLSAFELVEAFGTEKPTGADLERVFEPGVAGCSVTCWGRSGAVGVR